jgi:chromosome segregation ATPase
MTEQKKRGRPRKDPMIEAVEKKRVTAESVREEWAQHYNALQTKYDEILADVVIKNKALEEKLNNLEYQAVGYRAVISYLENTIERLVNNPVRGN